MDENQAPSNEPDEETAAQAFSRLDGRIAMMARAVGHLAAERASIDIPDYSATLGQMNTRLAAVAQGLAAIAQKPAMQLTPEGLATRIEAAAAGARATDRQTLQEAREAHKEAARIIHGLVSSVRDANTQRRHLQWTGIGGLVAGCLLWSILPGVVLRALPKSWYMPEKMAAHIMRKASLWDVGERMMRADSPLAWERITAAVRIQRDNLMAIQACETASRKIRKTVRCTVSIHNRDQSSIPTRLYPREHN